MIVYLQIFCHFRVCGRQLFAVTTPWSEELHYGWEIAIQDIRLEALLINKIDRACI